MKDVAYKVDVAFLYSENRVLTGSVDSLGFTWNMIFKINTGASIVSQNSVSFRESVESDVDGIYIKGGTLVEDQNGGYFVTNGNGGTDFGKGNNTVFIDTDGSTPFIIQVYMKVNGNDAVRLEFTIYDSPTGTTVDVVCGKNSSVIGYIGSGSTSLSSSGSVSPFTGSISIEVDGNMPNSGMTMQVKLIPVNTTQTMG